MAKNEKNSKPVEGEIVNEAPYKSRKNDVAFIGLSGNSVIMNIGLFVFWIAVVIATIKIWYGTPDDDVMSKILLIPLIAFAVYVVFYKFFK